MANTLVDVIPDEALTKYHTEIISDPVYKTLTPEERDQAREEWFKVNVLPHADDTNRDAAIQAFDYATAGDLKQVYKDPEFLKASTETQKALLRKNMLARGENPDENRFKDLSAGQMGMYGAMADQTRVGDEYAKFLSDPDVQKLMNRGTVGQLAKPVTGINQTIEYLNPFTSHEERAKRLQSIQDYSNETKKIEEYFPDQKVVGMAAEVAPYVATGGIAAGAKGLTGFAARAGVAGATAATTTTAEGEGVGNQKATTGAIAMALQGLFEGIPAAYSSLIKYKNSNAAERAVQHAAEELAKINGTTVEQELAKSATKQAANAGNLAGTGDELADLASQKLINKEKLTEKQVVRLQEALKAKLATPVGEGSSKSIATGLQTDLEAGIATRDAKALAKVDEINATPLGAAKGSEEAPKTISQRFMTAVQDWKDKLKPAYQAEVGPAESAVVSTYSDVKNALDSTSVAGSPKSIKDTPSLNGNTKAYQNIAGNVKEAPESQLDANTQAIVNNLRANGQEAQAKAIEEAAGVTKAEAVPMTLADLNRHIDDVEAQLSPAFQKDNPGAANVDVLKAQKRTLQGLRDKFLEANPDVAAKIGQADAKFIQGKSQFFQSGTDVAGNKTQNSVMKGLYEKAEAGSLTEKDLDKLFTTGNPVQNLSDLKKALGDTPETDALLTDAFHNWAKDKLPSGNTAAQNVKTLERLLGKERDTDFANLARNIKTGDKTTALDDLESLLTLHKNNEATALGLKNSTGAKAELQNKYLENLTKQSDSGKVISKAIEDPDGVGADAIRAFGHPEYGKALQISTIKDVATDMKNLSPLEMYNKYGSPHTNTAGTFGNKAGNDFFNAVTRGYPEEKAALEEAIATAKREIDTNAISEFKYGRHKVPEEIKGVGYMAGKNIAPTSTWTQLFNTIDKRLTAAQQEVLQKYFTKPEYAKEVTEKVLLGVQKEKAIDKAFRNNLKSIAAGAAVGPTSDVLTGKDATRKSILDTPHTPLKITVTPKAAEPVVLPEVELPRVDVQPEIGPQSSLTEPNQHDIIKGKLANAKPTAKAHKFVSDDDIEANPELFFHQITRNSRTGKPKFSDAKTVAEVMGSLDVA